MPYTATLKCRRPYTGAFCGRNTLPAPHPAPTVTIAYTDTVLYSKPDAAVYGLLQPYTLLTLFLMIC